MHFTTKKPNGFVELIFCLFLFLSLIGICISFHHFLLQKIHVENLSYQSWYNISHHIDNQELKKSMFPTGSNLPHVQKSKNCLGVQHLYSGAMMIQQKIPIEFTGFKSLHCGHKFTWTLSDILPRFFPFESDGFVDTSMIIPAFIQTEFYTPPSSFKDMIEFQLALQQRVLEQSGFGYFFPIEMLGSELLFMGGKFSGR